MQNVNNKFNQILINTTKCFDFMSFVGVFLTLCFWEGRKGLLSCGFLSNGFSNTLSEKSFFSDYVARAFRHIAQICDLIWHDIGSQVVQNAH